MKYSFVIRSTRLRLVFCYNLFTVFEDVSRGNAKINGEKCGKGDHLVEKNQTKLLIVYLADLMVSN